MKSLALLLVTLFYAAGYQQEHIEKGGAEPSEDALPGYNDSINRSIEQVPSEPPENLVPELGICQIYTGRVCEQYMSNHSVFIPPDMTMEMLEDKLAAAAGVIKNSPDKTPLCSRFAWYALCATVFPICRTPEETNHHYFSNKNRAKGSSSKFVTKKSKKSNQKKQQQTKAKSTPNIIRIVPTEDSYTTTTTHRTIDLSHISNSYYEYDRRRKRFVDIQSIKNGYPPTKNTENLRRICRNDCELLENEICQKEYAIAKRHPTIGQILVQDCTDLEEEDECISMGININIKPDDTCYWENGAGYRGIKDKTINNRPCIKWSKASKQISHIELSGNNYCRNVDQSQKQPWCYVDKQKTVELCDIPKCADRMWFLVICGLVAFLSLTLCFTLLVCCKKMRKQGVSNIQNIQLPNVDKNIYGNSAHSPQIEMTSLLTQHSHGNAPAVPPHGRGSILKIPQYSLHDVKFVEELGEGAFGKVYKGDLLQKNGEKVIVAVKALKENASPKTQQDFRREIELISDLKHPNIVNILGVVLKEEPLCMLFEYMSHGDLHEFLISNSSNEGKYLSQQQFLFVALQIAEGMEYLSAHHYIHRDLAARNCLVGEDLIVKISDFGLSRDIYSSDYYRVQSKSLLPIRWMSSEAILYGKFTTESDVWSYGVVLWEIYSYGVQPYFGFSNPEVINMVRARQLLPCPEACPSAVYALMIECWHEQSVRRPTFAEIVHRIKLWYCSQKRRDQMDIHAGSMNRQMSVTTGSTATMRSYQGVI